MFDINDFRKRQVPNEEEIEKNWGRDKEKPTISIACTTFNQEEYIEDCLRGFLLQECDVRYEIVIHDDASTDNTVKIIREYKKRYPRLIRLIEQSENQFSKNVQLPFHNVLKECQGEYTALCEGDDFWIDSKKLKHQHQCALKNPEVNLFFHAAFQMTDGQIDKKINSYFRNETLVDTSWVIRGGGGVMPTASIFTKTSLLKRLPEWFNQAPVGDYYVQCLMAENGAIFLPRCYSVYRFASSTSVSQKTNKLNNQKLVMTIDKEIASLESLDRELNFEFSRDINFWKSRIVFSKAIILLRNRNYELYIKYLIKSVKIYKYNGSLQRILYNVRWSAKISYFVLMLLDRMVVR